MKPLLVHFERHQKALVLGGLTLLSYYAAINRTQALPWAIAALLLATLAIGFSAPHWLIKRLSVTRTGPARAEENEVVQFEVEVRNHGWLPRFMVEAVDRLPFVGAAAGVAQPEAMLGLVAYVGGGSGRSFRVPLLCEKRGFYQLGPVGLATSFPLGLAQARQRKNGGVQTLTIYPDIFPIVALPLKGTPSEIHRGGFLLPESTGSAEFSGLREYRRGDNPRHVHWPTTARLGELMVKEFEPLASACLFLALDQSQQANVGQGKHSSFEYAVRIAASIGRYGCNSGMPIRLHGEGERSLEIGHGAGEAHFRELLDALAVVEADGRVPYAQALQTVALHCRHGQTVIVFLSQPEREIAATLQALSLLLARGAHLLAIVFDRASFEGKASMPAAPSPAPADPWSGLLDLGIPLMTVRRGDDLMRLFNP